MGWIAEIYEGIAFFRFAQIVNEYEAGLYFRNGRVRDRRVRLSPEKLEEIAAEEAELWERRKQKLKRVLGWKRFLPWVNPSYSGRSSINPNPKGHYRTSWLSKKPRHPTRYERSKILQPGLYFHIPLIDRIEKDTTTPVVVDLPDRSIPVRNGFELRIATATGYEDLSRIEPYKPAYHPEDGSVLVSCNIHYQIINFYKAFTQVNDYQDTFITYATSMLSRLGRGKTYDFWKDEEQVEALELKLKEALKKEATSKWGLQILDVFITEGMHHSAQRVFHEGMPHSLSLEYRAA